MVVCALVQGPPGLAKIWQIANEFFKLEKARPFCLPKIAISFIKAASHVASHEPAKDGSLVREHNKNLISASLTVEVGEALVALGPG